MSHELRTPLNAIIGYSELLMRTRDGGQTGALTDLERIRSAGKHLLMIINDILDLSKIEAGQMQGLSGRGRTAARSRRCREHHPPWSTRIRTSCRSISRPISGTMRVDVTKLRQSLFNLLSNAAKFCHHGTISLGARRTGAVASSSFPCAIPALACRRSS